MTAMTAADGVRSRTAQSREAILDAVAALIHEEGAASVTHQRVAERAGVGRATVYRHWPNPADLLADALARTNLEFLEPAPGTLVERLRADMHRIAGELNALPDTDELLAQLLGPLWVRRMVQGTPITDTLVERTIDAALQPWLTPERSP